MNWDYTIEGALAKQIGYKPYELTNDMYEKIVRTDIGLSVDISNKYGNPHFIKVTKKVYVRAKVLLDFNNRRYFK